MYFRAIGTGADTKWYSSALCVPVCDANVRTVSDSCAVFMPTRTCCSPNLLLCTYSSSSDKANTDDVVAFLCNLQQLFLCIAALVIKVRTEGIETAGGDPSVFQEVPLFSAIMRVLEAFTIIIIVLVVLSFFCSIRLERLLERCHAAYCQSDTPRGARRTAVKVSPTGDANNAAGDRSLRSWSLPAVPGEQPNAASTESAPPLPPAPPPGVAAGKGGWH